MKGRYLKKFETIQKEVEFIKTHKMWDEVTERALLYSVEVCVEAAMDIVAMRVKDVGMVVEDDYANIEKLVRGESSPILLSGTKNLQGGRGVAWSSLPAWGAGDSSSNLGGPTTSIES